MRATELIGKMAIRTAPIMEKRMVSNGLYSFGENVIEMPDYSYTTEPIKIINATESHIVYERKNFDAEIKTSIMNNKFCDDNWTDYEVLIGKEVDIK